MIILQTIKISKSFGMETILTDINIQIHTNDRIGLVGINGAGKSTLVKIITSNISPDNGEVQYGKNIKVGYLAQNSAVDSENTIWDEMKLVFSNLINQENIIRALEAKMSNSSYLNNDKKYEKLMDEYSKLTDTFKDSGGYSYEAKIRSVLHGLGFSDTDYYSHYIKNLSGGQKTRLAMAKLLLDEPELLILDEPTNYLDIETMTWLEGYLKSYSGAILIVSHDRFFLDSLVNIIYEISNTEIFKYIGNYSQFIEQKNLLLEQQNEQFIKQQEEVKKLEDFIQKNITRASTTQRAQSRRKVLEKMDIAKKPIRNRNVSLSFNTQTPGGKNVLMIKNLSMGFKNKILFENISFNVYKQEKIALIGANGTGKSTLLKLIYNKLNPISGSIELGTNIKVAYYDQEQDNLNLEKNVIDEIWDDYPNLTEQEVRTILGSFLFINEDVFKKIKNLSGGEKARVTLVKLMLKEANFLLLDEPTNHLDTYSREVLENALINYRGTILFVSHDRYFLNRVSTRTLELSATGLANYLGNYDYYLEKKAELDEINTVNQIDATKHKDNNKFAKERENRNYERQLNRKLESLENKISNLEKEIIDIEIQLTQPEIFSDHKATYSINEELDNLKNQLNNNLNEWSELQTELEN